MGTDHISDAWRITIDNKYLWLLGIIASLQLGGYSLLSSLESLNIGARLFKGDASYTALDGIEPALWILASIAAWLVGIWARAGLVHSVSQIREYTTPGFINSLRHTAPFIIPLAIMQIMVWSLLIIFSIGAATNFSGSSSIGFACGSIFLLVGLIFIDAFAFRSMTIGNLNNPIKGIIHGSQTLLKSLGSIIKTAIAYIVLSIAISLCIGLPLMLLTSAIQNAAPSLPAILVVIYDLLTLILGVTLFAISPAFTSALFTLIHKEHADISQLLPVQISNDDSLKIQRGGAHELHKKYNF